jgi:hypothetical protein
LSGLPAISQGVIVPRSRESSNRSSEGQEDFQGWQKQGPPDLLDSCDQAAMARDLEQELRRSGGLSGLAETRAS